MQVVAPQSGDTWNSNKAIWLIPQTAITNDTNLAQDPDYVSGGTDKLYILLVFNNLVF